MAGACGRGDLSEGETKEKSERWGGVKQQGELEEHNQKNTCTLGSASLGYICVCHLMWNLIGELKVSLFWNVKAYEQLRENTFITGVAILLVPNLFPITENVNKALMSCWLHHPNLKELCQGNIWSHFICHCSLLSNNVLCSNISLENHSTPDMFAKF